MSIVVEVKGLELHGFHGVNEDERRDGQRFLYDLELAVSEESLADRIEDAVDYREVVACVREINERPFQLLEALAAAVADAILARFPAERVVVKVRKPDVRLEAPVEHTAATVVRP